MQPHQQRVVDEKQELDYKLGKLLTFIDAGKGVIFSTLNNEDRERLTTQARIMREYSDILADRVAAFPQSPATEANDGGISTFNPSKHGRAEVLQVEIWRGEGIRIARDGHVVCQGRSVGDMLKAIGQFLELRLTIDDSNK